MQKISADDRQDAASGFAPWTAFGVVGEESARAEVVANRRSGGDFFKRSGVK